MTHSLCGIILLKEVGQYASSASVKAAYAVLVIAAIAYMHALWGLRRREKLIHRRRLATK